jgi:hypothetical protein
MLRGILAPKERLYAIYSVVMGKVTKSALYMGGGVIAYKFGPDIAHGKIIQYE